MPGWIAEKFRTRRVRYAATTIVVAILALLAVFVRGAVMNRMYTSYSIEKSVDKTDSVSRFEYVGGYVIRYSKDGASLMNQSLETVWTTTFSMEDPRAQVTGGQILLYDRLGTDFHIFNKKEKVSSFSTDRPILKACISERDTVAALLRDGDGVSLVYYTKDGSMIAGGESTMQNPGYPVSLSLSSNGMLLAVSYLTAADGTVGSAVRFYNFGSGGKGKADNMTAEFRYPGIFAPEVQYLDGSECAIFRDDGFTIVKGADKPEEQRSVIFCSVFHDGSNLGFINRSGNRDHKYVMNIYSASGNLMSSVYVDVSYERVRVCGSEVILSSHSEFSVFSTKGKMRFHGRLKEGNIADALRIGRDRILVLTDQKMEVIKLQ